MSKFDQDERELLEAFEARDLKRAPDAADTQKRHQEYAEAMFKKDARINTRLSSKDLRPPEEGAGGGHSVSNPGCKHHSQAREGRLREDR